MSFGPEAGTDLNNINTYATETLDDLATIWPPRDSIRLRNTEIDVLSCLGASAVGHLVSAETSIIADWPTEDKHHVSQLASLRTAGISRVKANFPDIFGPDDGLTLPQLDEDIPRELLRYSVERHSGTLPVLITAPHDGNLNALGPRLLPQRPLGVMADGGTSYIARDIRNSLIDSAQAAPTVLVDRIQRNRRTLETRAYFEEQTLGQLCTMRRAFGNDQPILHLDIHGFGHHDETEAYDLIFGTGHRKTVGVSDVDTQLGAFAAQRGYHAYTPSEYLQPYEYFTAENPGTLIQRVRSLGIPQVASIQIEIHRRFRTQETKAAGQKLAANLGTFCLEWASRSQQK